MELDVRLPMGTMFVLLGGVLTVYGLATLHQPYSNSLGINVNLWWGLVILIFGILMLLLAWRAKRNAPATNYAATRGDEEMPRPFGH